MSTFRQAHSFCVGDLGEIDELWAWDSKTGWIVLGEGDTVLCVGRRHEGSRVVSTRFLSRVGIVDLWFTRIKVLK